VKFAWKEPAFSASGYLYNRINDSATCQHHCIMAPLTRTHVFVGVIACCVLVGLVEAFLPAGVKQALHRRAGRVTLSTRPSKPTLAAAKLVDPPPPLQARPDWLPKIPEGCDSDYECEGTESCCDFIFFKMCCSDGGHTQEAWTPVPIPVRPGDGYQQGGGFGGNGGYSGGGGLYR